MVIKGNICVTYVNLDPECTRIKVPGYIQSCVKGCHSNFGVKSSKFKSRSKCNSYHALYNMY